MAKIRTLETISLEQTPLVSPLLKSYLKQDKNVSSLFEKPVGLDQILAQARVKKQQYSTGQRNLLCEEIQNTYQNTLGYSAFSKAQEANIALLKSQNTFTITTGHQLNLLGGPMYFVCKILEVIKISELANQNQEGFTFVPVFWLASEDHDFLEINHFYVQDKKYSWNQSFSGPVGRLPLDGLDKIFSDFLDQSPKTDFFEDLKQKITTSYLSSRNLSEATFKWVNALFSSYGILVIEPDNPRLKQTMVPYFQKEIVENFTYKNTQKTLENFPVKPQVNPREINLFYLGKNLRERIVKLQDGRFQVLNTDLFFSLHELLREIETAPEKFSPNVLLRPLYQELVLPNVMYVGGGGEIAYWLELKKVFESQETAFPILKLRNSLQLITQKQNKKRQALELDFVDLFLDPRNKIQEKVENESELFKKLSFASENLQGWFDELEKETKSAGEQFYKMYLAQRKKQTKGLEKLRQRMLKVESKKHLEFQERISALLEEIYPNQKLQERSESFLLSYLHYGDAFFSAYLSSIKDLGSRLIFLETEN